MTLTPMCLCLLTRRTPDGRREVLLGRRKKLGLGTGKVVGLGGHVEPNETAAEAAARETAEESGLIVAVRDLHEIADVTFRFPTKPAWDMQVAVFIGDRFTGDARETEEIAPRWYPIDDLPVQDMWDDNQYWLPQALAGQRLRAEFVFAEDCETVASSQVVHAPEDQAVEDKMARGRFANVRREGDTVVRHPTIDNSGSRALLRHFEDKGSSLTPRLLEASEQHERLSYIPGVTGYPPLTAALRSEEALVSVARAARTLHDLSVSFPDRAAYQWHPLETCRPVRDLEIIGHGDLAPWNIVFDGTEVTGIIDWDAAGPMTRSWDMAYLAHQLVPFHLGDDISSWGWDTPPDRRARLALLCEAYGGLDPQDVVDDAILRLHSTGMFLRQRIQAGDPNFDTQRRERHDQGFMAAAAKLAAHRNLLLDSMAP